MCFPDHHPNKMDLTFGINSDCFIHGLKGRGPVFQGKCWTMNVQICWSVKHSFQLKGTAFERSIRIYFFNLISVLNLRLL